MQAANEFEEQRARFFTENEIRDDYMEVTVLNCAKKKIVTIMLLFLAFKKKNHLRCF